MLKFTPASTAVCNLLSKEADCDEDKIKQTIKVHIWYSEPLVIWNEIGHRCLDYWYLLAFQFFVRIVWVFVQK